VPGRVGPLGKGKSFTPSRAGGESGSVSTGSLPRRRDPGSSCPERHAPQPPELPAAGLRDLVAALDRGAVFAQAGLTPRGKSTSSAYSCVGGASTKVARARQHPQSPGRPNGQQAQRRDSRRLPARAGLRADRTEFAAVEPGSDAALQGLQASCIWGQSTVRVQPPPAAPGCAAAQSLDVLSDATAQPHLAHRQLAGGAIRGCAGSSCFCNQCDQQRHPAAPTSQPGERGQQHPQVM